MNTAWQRSSIALAIALGASSLFGKGARASDIQVSKRLWRSSAHFGYSVEKQSSTGFGLVGGSTLFLDLTRRVAPGLDLGFRTWGNGGHGKPGTYYRMTTGPLIGYEIAAGWVVQGFLGMFSESGQTTDEREAYHSRGVAGFVGWEKSIELYEGVEFAWGGFLGTLRGRLSPAVLGSHAAPSSASKQKGLTQGLEIALRILL